MSDAASGKVTPGSVEGVDLENLFNRFRHTIELLETGNLTLEQSMETYEEGVRIQTLIHAELSKEERRLVEIVDENGVVSPFDVERDGRKKTGG